MANTPNMTLEIGVPGSTVGPDWAELIERNKDDIDAHDHTSTKGVKVPSAGINHNDEEDFGDNGILNARVVQLAERSSAPSDNAVLYRDSSGNLYWRSSTGANVQITSGTTLSATTLSNGFWQTEEVTSSVIAASFGSKKTLLRVNTLASAKTITLPAASTITAGQYWIVVDSGLGANTITFIPNGTDKINGQNASFVAKAVGGVLILTNLDQTDDWSLTSTISGTINSSSVATGYTLRRSSATAQTYEFAAFDLSGVNNAITGRVPSANMFQATTGAEGIVQLTNDFAGSSTAPTVVALTGASSKTVIRSTSPSLEWENSTSSPKLKYQDKTGANGSPLLIEGQGITAGVGTYTGGAVALVGGSPSIGYDYGVAALLSGTSYLSVRELSGSRRVAAIGIASPTSTEIPGGDGVLYVSNAGTAPSTSSGADRPVGGFLLYSSAGYPAWKVPNGQTTKWNDVYLSGSCVAGGPVSSPMGAIAGRLVVTINGTDYNIPLFN